MLIADSQDSRTQNQSATRPSGEPLTSEDSAVLGFLSHSATPMPSSGLAGGQSEIVPPPSAQTVGRVHRFAVLEGEILPRVSTERGQEAMLRRWYTIPNTSDLDTAATRLAAELKADDQALTELATWSTAAVPQRPGRSLPLPAPEPVTDRWQGHVCWVDGALAALAGSPCPRLARVGGQHRRMILQALASFADTATGRNVTAANETLGQRAADLCATHITRGGTWRGRRTDHLSRRTLTDHVSCMVAALTKAGWLIERARGRHLTRLERAVAWVRHHLHQTRAGSVRDLIVPTPDRVIPPAPTRPAWADHRNPHLRRLTLRNLRQTFTELIKVPVLRTHRAVGTLSAYLLLEDGYLTRAHATETPPPPRQAPTTAQPKPSLVAQRLAAALTSATIGMSWLLRSKTTGTPRHRYALARIIDQANATHLTAREITHHINHTLAQHHWELHPQTLTSPLAWFTTVLTQMPETKPQRDQKRTRSKKDRMD